MARPRLHLPDGLVMNGWATFEYAGHGQRTICKGDCINQIPGIAHREIACSEDFEVLEIVAPANFKTRIVEAPTPCRGRGVAFGFKGESKEQNRRAVNRIAKGEECTCRTVPPVATGNAQGWPRGSRYRCVACHPAPDRRGADRPDQDRPAAGIDRLAGLGGAATEARRRVLRQAPERQGRHPGTADRAPDRGHCRKSRQLRAQGAGDGGASGLPPVDRHHAVVGGSGGGAQARRMGLDLHLVR